MPGGPTNPHISRRTFVAGVGAAAAATAGIALERPAEATGSTSTSKPTVVLVHGGFADATASWTDVIQQLQRRGYTVMAPANPLRSLPYDSAYVASSGDRLAWWRHVQKHPRAPQLRAADDR